VPNLHSRAVFYDISFLKICIPLDLFDSLKPKHKHCWFLVDVTKSVFIIFSHAFWSSDFLFDLFYRLLYSCLVVIPNHFYYLLVNFLFCLSSLRLIAVGEQNSFWRGTKHRPECSKQNISKYFTKISPLFCHRISVISKKSPHFPVYPNIFKSSRICSRFARSEVPSGRRHVPPSPMLRFLVTILSMSLTCLLINV